MSSTFSPPGSAPYDAPMSDELTGSEGLSPPLRVTLIYMAVAGAWILASDRLVALFVRDPRAITGIQSYKGWFYVVVTALLLYALVRRAFSRLQSASKILEESYEATLQGWVRALDMRDKETELHTQRVTRWTVELAKRMGIPTAQRPHVRRGALLHDIGKIAIPDSILHKPGPLDESEMEIVRRHPSDAHDLLAPIEYLHPAIDIPWAHHERWDGTGYPRGLAGEAIPLAARIFAVIDVWDALTSDRPYRAAWDRERALQYITSQRAAHFDPRVVDEFRKMFTAGSSAPGSP